MGSFDAAWLALREPADAAARADALATALAARLGFPAELRVADLGSGTGANARYLLSRLPSPQAWLLADADPALLAVMAGAMALWAPSHACRTAHAGDGVDVTGATIAARLTSRQADLTDDSALDALVAGRHLVTASALLDLVSAAWLEALLARCRDAGAAVLFALSYDGRLACEPVEPGDELVRELVNTHQQGDKGFGPALGPTAASAAARQLAGLGYTVRTAASDWRLGIKDAALQRSLIDGWATAAREAPGAARDAVDAWHARRLAHLDAGRSTLIVGHQDLAAWLP